MSSYDLNDIAVTVCTFVIAVLCFLVIRLRRRMIARRISGMAVGPDWEGGSEEGLEGVWLDGSDD